jgi:hypothetical protein
MIKKKHMAPSHAAMSLHIVKIYIRIKKYLLAKPESCRRTVSVEVWRYVRIC